MIKKLYYLGVRFRNPSYFSILKALQNSDFGTKEELQHLQTDKLRDLLSFAEEHSPYYKRVFDEIGYSPCKQFGGMSDLKNLPITTKQDLISFNREVHTSRHNFAKLFFSETSGSTGEPLTFEKDEYWDSANRATIARGLSWHGVDPSDRNGYLWGFSFTPLSRMKIALLDGLQNRFRLFHYDNDKINIFLRKAKRAKYLHGYSSVLNELANQANAAGKSLDNIKLVKGTSEKIYPSYIDASKRAFGVPMISEYGSAETGIIGFECPHGQVHVNEEGVILEEVDGEAIVTNLYSKSFPVIRYRLGDAITISDELCPCGRKSRIISDILGRVGKSIVGLSGKRYPSLTFYYICKNIALKHGLMLAYQAVQRQPGKVEMRVLKDSLNHKTPELIKKEAASYFSSDVIVEVTHCDSLHAENGKLKDFITYID